MLNTLPEDFLFSDGFMMIGKQSVPEFMSTYSILQRSWSTDECTLQVYSDQEKVTLSGEGESTPTKNHSLKDSNTDPEIGIKAPINLDRSEADEEDSSSYISDLNDVRHEIQRN